MRYRIETQSASGTDYRLLGTVERPAQARRMIANNRRQPDVHCQGITITRETDGQGVQLHAFRDDVWCIDTAEGPDHISATTETHD